MPRVYVPRSMNGREVFHPDPGCPNLGNIDGPREWTHEKAEFYGLEPCKACTRQVDTNRDDRRLSLRELLRERDMAEEAEGAAAGP